jgi:hypothetical protein
MSPSNVISHPGGHPDLALAERCRQNEPGAFEEVYRLHAPRLFGVAYRLVGVQEAEDLLDEEFQKFLGTGAEGLARLTETELLAKIVEGEPTLAVRDKTLLVVSVLQEAGDLEFMQDRAERGRAFYLKGLHLLLEVLAREDVFEWPEFVPKVEAFMAGLQDSILPMRTQAMLMRHYERTGQFAKAEDALFAMVEEDPANARLLEFGLSFYERLKGQSDAALNEGNLPRPEVEAGFADLQKRIQPR